MSTVSDRVMQIIAQTAGVEAAAIKPESTILDLGVASLDAIDMLFKIEEVFGIELDNDQLDLKSASVANLVRAVERATGEDGASLVATPAG